jgi:cobalt-zinc-cadmium efflux system outer membrane protein
MSFRNRFAILLIVVGALAPLSRAASPLTFDQVVDRFKANNPTVAADLLNIGESRANEITAGLRPNPDLNIANDQYNFLHFSPYYRPLQNVEGVFSLSYLIERRHKRELRLESAQEGTRITESAHQDLLRNLLFTLRGAFVSALQAKSLLALARENLDYYDKEIKINRDRYEAGDLAKIDYQRVELQRVQFESDYQTAIVNLRTAKIQLLQLLNDRTPIDEFDITGAFEYQEAILVPDELHRQAIASRPDLEAALRTITQAKTNNRLAWANGSTDPTVGVSASFNGSPGGTGWSLDIPLRIFDRNQGEKERTALEINRTEHQRDAAVASVYSDVDTAYATVDGVRNLIRPYRDKYLKEAEQVRETVSFAFQHGGASLLDFLAAQKEYRDTQVAYRTLIGSYLTAAAQLNMAVGREVIP